MWTVTMGATGGLATSTVNAVKAIVEAAAEIWDWYIDSSLANIQIRTDIVPLDSGVLATGGADFFFDHSKSGRDYYAPSPVIELRDGVDSNGLDPDIYIEIDLNRLEANEFYLTPPVNGVSVGLRTNSVYDLLSIVIHEVGHGLGFVSSFAGVGSDRTLFDQYVTTISGNYYFNGPLTQAEKNDMVALDADLSHTANWERTIMRPTIDIGMMYHITPLDLAMFADIGVRVRTPTRGDDVIYGFVNSSDEFYLRGGDDVFYSLQGTDTVWGGNGNDTIYGGEAIVELHGGNGNDSLFGAPGWDRLYGDDGEDYIEGGDAQDTLYGGDGNDTLVGGGDGNYLYGGSGQDTVDYSSKLGRVAVNLSSTDISTANGTIFEHSARDVFGDGDGVQDFENIIGSPYADTLVGGSEHNFFAGGDGDDSLLSGVGDDTLAGQLGNDTVQGGGGNDKVHGNGGDDKVFGGSGDDKLTGSAGADTLNGGDGNDKIYGNAGGDKIVGGLGNDLLVGLDGDDFFYGGGGADTLKGGTGNDTLLGGAAADQFEFETETGQDIVTDFSTTLNDVIRLKGFGAAFDTFAEVIAAASQVAADTVIDLGGGDTLTLIGVNTGDLHQDDFIFG